MQDSKARGLKRGVLAFLAVSVVGLALPALTDAGGVRLSIGIGIPAPVYVAPAPVFVAPAPIIVQPAPRIVYPPPVVYTAPYGVYGHHYPSGIAKPYYGYHPAHSYKFYKHGRHYNGKHYRKHYRDDD
jgi:PXPV repeat (3 copies)